MYKSAIINNGFTDIHQLAEGFEKQFLYLELSIKLGKSPGYIHDVLSRRIDPSTISLFAMAAYFNCPIIECSGAPVESLDTLFRVLR
ncbi:MAG: helix-turn-helix transcriptional regulator, partial [Acutalibacteraceae bacterium]|nr:helix-turn-helix transcriptional regulator [Acutalibacteraceae bacterium]